MNSMGLGALGHGEILEIRPSNYNEFSTQSPPPDLRGFALLARAFSIKGSPISSFRLRALGLPSA